MAYAYGGFGFRGRTHPPRGFSREDAGAGRAAQGGEECRHWLLLYTGQKEGSSAGARLKRRRDLATIESGASPADPVHYRSGPTCTKTRDVSQVETRITQTRTVSPTFVPQRPARSPTR
eukprot:6744582-Prymnesium_polylepis.1